MLSSAKVIKNLELKKHVNAIHCTNNLTLVQRKLFNALLFNAYPELSHKSFFQIQSRELCNLIGYNSNDYGKLKKALIGLITIAIEWNIIDCITGKETQWKASSILSAVELADGYCRYEYSHVMKELLYQPEIYGRINIYLMSKFKSTYGLALYENCIRYQGLTQTPWFTLEVFRKLMGVFGEKYLAFKDFKKRVLCIAISEVNNLSPLYVEPEIERKNQQVMRIRFKFTKNALFNDLIDSKQTIDAQMINTLTNTFGFSQLLVKEIMKKYDHNYIQEKIDVIIRSDSFKTGKIRGLAGYLVEALRKDYKLDLSSQSVLEQQRKVTKNKIKNKQLEENNQKHDYNQYVNHKVQIYLEALTTEEHNELLNDFLQHMTEENSVLQGWFHKYKFEHPGVRSNLHHFIKKFKATQLGKLLSYEEFINLPKLS